MDIPRLDMLPDESQTIPAVSEDVNPQIQEVEEQEETQPTVTQEKQEKQVKTPENELLAALKEERSRRKELEDKIKTIESSTYSEIIDDDSLSIEGKMLKQKYSSLEEKFARLEQQREEDRVFGLYPQLRDKFDEFNEFKEHPDNKGMSLQTSAKAFLIERDMLDIKPRKGLEKPTGGSKQEPNSITAADVDRLMKTQPRKFIEMVRSGKIKAEDIK